MIEGDAAQAEAEPGLVGGGNDLRDVSCLVWPGRARGSRPRLQPKQKAPAAECEKGSPLKCCRNISEASWAEGVSEARFVESGKIIFWVGC